MPYCDRCDRYFRIWPAFNQHLNNSASHNICDDCNIDFPNRSDLQNHWIQSPYHSYCRWCNEHFDDDDDLEDHYDSAHFYCAPCKRLFQSANNLRAHLNSSVHQPRNVKCRGRGCDMTFVSISAMILHLETGKCVSGINRAYVDQKVREYDRNNIITDPSRMITGPSSQGNSRYYATGAAWNGSAYECYLCHKFYSSLLALNQHLGSPRHQEKFYLCPLNTCRTRFSTLSGLCQHIESQRCGIHKFRVVKDTMDSVLNGMRRLNL